MNIGYIGLGAMGGALARRLMLSRKMPVFDTRREIIDAFESEGAIGARDLPVLARESDVNFVCVPTSAVVRDVVFGQGSLAEGLAPGKIVVDQSTGDRTVTRKIAVELDKLGAALVAAPVSGGAVAGTIAIMCGGPERSLAVVRPILEAISPSIVSCGDTGNGHVSRWRCLPSRTA